MQVHPLAYGRPRAQQAARRRRLLEKFAIALGGAILLSTFLFALAHLSDAMSTAPADPAVSEVYFPNCAAARAAGAAPIYATQPGYRPGLDADQDGVACEPYRNWGANN